MFRELVASRGISAPPSSEPEEPTGRARGQRSRSEGGQHQRAALVLDADLTAPAHARRAVRTAVADAGLGADVVDLAVLLTSELVTNAVLHGEGRPCVEVTAGLAGIRVGVSDGSSAAPVVQVVGSDARGGRGLAILDDAADAWDVTYTARGKTVWFEIHTA